MSDIAISLAKDDIIDLTKDNPSLTKIRVCLGWDETTDSNNQAYDLDAMAFICRYDESNNPKLISNGHFIFYKHLTSPDGAIVHQGDNLTGSGEDGSDKEQILANLKSVESDASEIAFFVNIYEAAKRGHHFGMVKNAFIRIVDDETGNEIARYDLSEDFSGQTVVQFGSLFRNDGEWDFKAIGVGFKRELMDVLRAYGANV